MALVTGLKDSDLAAFWGETPLHTAVRLNDPAAIEGASASGAKPHAKDALGWTPLHLAAALDHDEVLGRLLSHGADIDALSHDGRTALGLAAAAGSPRAVQSLLAAGASLSVPGEERGVLADASTGGSLEVLEALARAGATTTEAVPYLAMALRLTGHRVRFAERGYSRGMDEKPDRWLVDPEMRLPWSLVAPIGKRPEVGDGSAAVGDWVERWSTMVWDGFATFDVSPGAGGEGDGATKDEPGFRGTRPASLTFRGARLGEVAVTQEMLMEVLDGRIPGLSLPRALPALLRLAQVDPTMIDTQSPALAPKMFQGSITQGAPELLGALLEAGVNPNLRNPSGLTPLMTAAAWGLGPAAEALIEHGADLSLRDGQGRTAADIAQAAGKFALAKRLGFKARASSGSPSGLR